MEHLLRRYPHFYARNVVGNFYQCVDPISGRILAEVREVTPGIFACHGNPTATGGCQAGGGSRLRHESARCLHVRSVKRWLALGRPSLESFKALTGLPIASTAEKARDLADVHAIAAGEIARRRQAQREGPVSVMEKARRRLTQSKRGWG